MAEPTTNPEGNTVEPTLSYDTYRRAISEKKKLQKQMDDLQAQLTAINKEKEKEEEKRIAETGQYKQMYEKMKADFEAETGKVQNYTNELNTYKEMIANDIPEEIKETFDIYNLSIKQLQVLAEKSKPIAPTPGSQNSDTKPTEVDASKMDLQQLNNLAVTNPQAYSDYMNKYLSKQ